MSSTKFYKNNCSTCRIITKEWCYIWGNGIYSLVKDKIFMGQSQAPPVHFKWLWKSCCQKRHKVFFGLLSHDGLNTRNLLNRKNLHLQSYNCVCCQLNAEETLRHLFFECHFAQSCWDNICPQRTRNTEVYDALHDIHRKIDSICAIEIIIIAAWAIWITRNNMVFNQIQPTIQQWRSTFKKEFALVVQRAKFSIAIAAQSWIDTNVFL
uniref:Reverse transcriptase zinc-binding domain-containing protein n=1 Tax=Arundo donax TaxID=35708 RepID=A0A0A9D6Q3_ARUDO